MGPMNTDELTAPEYFISVNGTRERLADATMEALREVLRKKGIVTFAAVVDGAECNSPAELVEEIKAGNNVEIRTYAKPGA